MIHTMSAKALAHDVLYGHMVTKKEALALYNTPLDELTQGAETIRRHMCGNGFDLCTIVNGKSGACSENCTFCAQSSCSRADIAVYPLMTKDEIVAEARRQDAAGVLRFSIVTSGRRLSAKEVDDMCDAIRHIRAETSLSVCVSFGLLDEAAFIQLKEAGASRVHNNLEASRRFFPKICTTHSTDDKMRAIRAAQKAGLSVCSGGILGLGETREDRIDLALELRELGIKSVPVNILNAIAGTPLEGRPPLSGEEVVRTVAIFRFLLPDAAIRLAGGRGLFTDKGRAAFKAGANAAITGDMLTTAGISVETDKALLNELGFEVRYDDE